MSYLSRPDIIKAMDRAELIVVANSISPKPSGTHRPKQPLTIEHVRHIVGCCDNAFIGNPWLWAQITSELEAVA